MAQPGTIPPRVRFVMTMERIFRRWLPIFLALLIIINLLPLLAPAAMQLGWTGVAHPIYGAYGLISHQLANRSFFLFGEQLMLTPADLPLDLTGDPVVDSRLLRAFRGSPELGWKMAWSDRLLAMYGSMLLVTFVYAARRWQRFPLRWGILLVLPLILDGATHYISDFHSLTAGFRYDNGWLAVITGHAFSDTFYIGDHLGSFNSWMRLLTGLLFGIGFLGWGLPIAGRYFERNAAILAAKLSDWQQRQRERGDA